MLYSPPQICSTVSHLIRLSDTLFAACDVYGDFVFESVLEAFSVSLAERIFALFIVRSSAKGGRSRFAFVHAVKNLKAIKLCGPQRYQGLLHVQKLGCVFTCGVSMWESVLGTRET